MLFDIRTVRFSFATRELGFIKFVLRDHRTMPFHFRKSVNALFYTILAAAIGLSISQYEITDEDRYVKQFGNNPNTSREWDRMKEYCAEEDLLKAKKLCASAHKKMYGNYRFMIEKLEYKNGTLLFNNPKYQPMRLAYVEYNLQKRDMPDDLREYSLFNEKEHFYLTQGFNKGCAFFLEAVRNASVPEFNLSKHVCGLKHKYI